MGIACSYGEAVYCLSKKKLSEISHMLDRHFKFLKCDLNCSLWWQVCCCYYWLKQLLYPNRHICTFTTWF